MSGVAWITGVGVVSPTAAEAGRVDDARLDAWLSGLPDKHLRHADRAGRLAVAAARDALRGCPPPHEAIGCAFGVDYGTYPSNLAHQRRILAEGARFASPAEFTLTLPNVTTAFVALAFGLRGPTCTVADGGVAGGTALGIALDWIRAGVAARVLVGVAEPHDPACAVLFDGSPLARTPPRPEVAAVWLCEAADSARERGAPPIAVLAGYGAATDPEAARAAALSDAGGGPADGGPPTDLWHLSGSVAGLRRRTLACFVGCPPQARAVVLEPAA